jgi:hypothetical protein
MSHSNQNGVVGTSLGCADSYQKINFSVLLLSFEFLETCPLSHLLPHRHPNEEIQLR